jgi:hypothetical protein
MVWMLAAAGVLSPRHGHPAMAPMARAGTPAPVLAVSILAAGCCAAAAIPWLARAIGPGPRVTDRGAASQAVMSAGMAAMLIATL